MDVAGKVATGLALCPLELQILYGEQEMKIAVTANGNDLDAPVSLVVGRCSTFVFVDTGTMTFEAVANPALSASGGAGIQAAQFVVEYGTQAVLSGNVGPNAYEVFLAANVPVYLVKEGTGGKLWKPTKQGNFSPRSKRTHRLIQV